MIFQAMNCDAYNNYSTPLSADDFESLDATQLLQAGTKKSVHPYGMD